MWHMTLRRVSAVAVAVLTAALVGCGADAPDTASDEPTSMLADGTENESSTQGSQGSEVSLSGICPDPLVVQTSWFHEMEYGWLFELIGEDGERDASKGTFSGRVNDITVEIRPGGPFIGNQTVAASVYEDPDVFMGTLETDEAMRGWATGQPLVQVMAAFDKSPAGFAFNPEKYDFKTIEDVREAGVTVLYFEGSGYMDYYLGRGLLDSDQVDASHNGSPDRWIATDGGIVQSVFVTQDAIRWEHELEQWMKPVGTLLNYDQGYQPYEGVSVRPEALEERAECLRAFVPMLQQSIVDFAEDPQLAAEQIALLNSEIGDFWQTSVEHNLRSHKKMFEIGVISNAGNETVGDFDMDRLGEQMAIYNEIYDKQNVDVPDEVTPETLVTNEFLDRNIGL